jgi:hypothetical protein
MNKLFGAGNKILNPFASKRARITIDASLEGGPVNLSTDISLPYNVLIGILLGAVSAVSENWARQDSLLIKPKIEETQKGGNDGKEENSHN